MGAFRSGVVGERSPSSAWAAWLQTWCGSFVPPNSGHLAQASVRSGTYSETSRKFPLLDIE